MKPGWKKRATRRAIKKAKEKDYQEPLPGGLLEENITYSIARADEEMKKDQFDLALANLKKAYKLSEQFLSREDGGVSERKKYAIAVVRRLGRVLDKSPDEEQQEYAANLAYKIRVENQIKSGPLERAIKPIIAIAGLGLGLFFLSSNITGNAISNLSQGSSNIIGVILFALGLLGGYFYFKK